MDDYGGSRSAQVLSQLDTIAPVTMVEVASVDLASFDQFCTEMGVQMSAVADIRPALLEHLKDLAPANGAGMLRRDGPAGRAGNAELRAVSAGSDLAGMRATAQESKVQRLA